MSDFGRSASRCVDQRVDQRVDQHVVTLSWPLWLMVEPSTLPAQLVSCNDSSFVYSCTALCPCPAPPSLSMLLTFLSPSTRPALRSSSLATRLAMPLAGLQGARTRTASGGVYCRENAVFEVQSTLKQENRNVCVGLCISTTIVGLSGSYTHYTHYTHNKHTVHTHSTYTQYPNNPPTSTRTPSPPPPRVVAQCAAALPPGKPRYVMGIGYPLDVVVCSALGADMYDSVYPTRTARFGVALVPEGVLKLRNASNKRDFRCVEAWRG